MRWVDRVVCLHLMGYVEVILELNLKVGLRLMRWNLNSVAVLWLDGLVEGNLLRNQWWGLQRRRHRLQLLSSISLSRWNLSEIVPACLESYLRLVLVVDLLLKCVLEILRRWTDQTFDHEIGLVRNSGRESLELFRDLLEGLWRLSLGRHQLRPDILFCPYA